VVIRDLRRFLRVFVDDEDNRLGVAFRRNFEEKGRWYTGLSGSREFKSWIEELESISKQTTEYESLKGFRCSIAFDGKALIRAFERSLDTEYRTTEGYSDTAKTYTENLKEWEVPENPEQLSHLLDQLISKRVNPVYVINISWGGLREQAVLTVQTAIYGYRPYSGSIFPPAKEIIESTEMSAEDFRESVVPTLRDLESSLLALRMDAGLGFTDPEAFAFELDNPLFFFLNVKRESDGDTIQEVFRKERDSFDSLINQLLLGGETSAAFLEGEILMFKRYYSDPKEKRLRSYYLLLYREDVSKSHHASRLESKSFRMAGTLAYQEYWLSRELSDASQKLMSLRDAIAFLTPEASTTLGYMGKIVPHLREGRLTADIQEAISLTLQRTALLIEALQNRREKILEVDRDVVSNIATVDSYMAKLNFDSFSGFSNAKTTFLARNFLVNEFRKHKQIMMSMLNQSISSLMTVSQTLGGVGAYLETVASSAMQMSVKYLTLILFILTPLLAMMPILSSGNLGLNPAHALLLIAVALICALLGYFVIHPSERPKETQPINPTIAQDFFAQRLEPMMAEHANYTLLTKRLKSDTDELHKIEAKLADQFTSPDKMKPLETRKKMLQRNINDSTTKADKLFEQLRKEEGELDREIAVVWDELKLLVRKERERNLRGEKPLKYIQRRTSVELSIEILLLRKPEPLPFPRILLLYFYKSTDFISRAMTSKSEVEAILGEDYKRIEETVKNKLSNEPEISASDFLGFLSQLRVEMQKQ
jgi:hypothetical protein